MDDHMKPLDDAVNHIADRIDIDELEEQASIVGMPAYQLMQLVLGEIGSRLTGFAPGSTHYHN
jgi:hypothetical protein